MRKKQQFVRPAVLQELSILPDSPVLAGSVGENVTVYSTGQKVEQHDFADDDFNHEWE